MRAIGVHVASARDSEGIARCFHEAYGTSYPNAWATSSSELAARIQQKVSIFAVALDEGSIVGATALEPRADGTGDLCHAAVLPSHRRLGLFTLMNAPLVACARNLGLSALFGRCVTSHPYSQRAMISIGSVIAGLSLGVAPRSMRFLGIQEELRQREACFDSVLLLEERQPFVEVHVPPPLRRAVAHVYATLSIECRFVRRAEDAPGLKISTHLDPELAIATIRLGVEGSLPEDALDEELTRLEAQGVEALYAELPLSSPACPRVSEALRALGFSFAAVLPGRADRRQDTLRLQRPGGETSEDVVVADHPQAKALRSLVFADRAAVAPAAAI